MITLYIAISGFLNFIASFILGIFILTKNKKSQINRTFSYICFSISIWSFFYIFFPIAKSKEIALLSFQLLHVGAVFISVANFHFIITWLDKYRQKRALLIFGYITAAMFVPTMFSSFFIQDIVPKSIFNFWAVPGLLYPFYLLHFFSFWIYSMILLFKELKHLTGIKLIQSKIIAVSFTIAVISGSTNYFLFYDIPILPVANILVLTYVGSIFYAILKYRLMDIRFMIGRIIIYFFSSISIIGFGVLLIFLNEKLNNPIPIHLAWFSVLVIGIFLFPYLFNSYQKIAGEHFYYTFYRLKTTIEELTKKFNQIIELDKLTVLIAQSLLNSLKIDMIGIILKQPKEENFYPQLLIKLSEKDISFLFTAKDCFLFKYLQNTKVPLILEEIPFIIDEIKILKHEDETWTQTQKYSTKLLSLKESADKINISVFTPLIIKDKLIGIIILGGKMSKKNYTIQDINLLSTLSSQSAIALNNALAYEEINKRKIELEGFYKLAVGRELKMMELKKEIQKMQKEKKVN